MKKKFKDAGISQNRIEMTTVRGGRQVGEGIFHGRCFQLYH